MRRRHVLIIAGCLLACLVLGVFLARPVWLGFDDVDGRGRGAANRFAHGEEVNTAPPGLAGRAADPERTRVEERTPDVAGPEGAKDRFEGRVVDESGRPVPGAHVEAHAGPDEPDLVETPGLRARVQWVPPEPFALVETDARGRFVIEDGADDVLLVARAAGYTTDALRVVITAKGVAGAALPTLRLAAVAPLRGRVEREDGSGVADVTVALLEGMNVNRMPLDDERTQTDADGRFKFEARPRGSDLALVALVPDHPTIGRRVRPDEQDVRIVLRSDAQATLRVLGAANALAIEGVRATVMILPKEREGLWLPNEWSGLTDDRGEVHFRAVAGGEIIVGFIHPSGATGWHAPGALGTSIRGPKEVRLQTGKNLFVYTFSPLASLSGRVTDSDGDPIVGARVRDEGAPFARAGRGVTTDEDGRYRIESVAVTDLELVVRAEGYTSLRDVVRIPPDFSGTFVKDVRLDRAFSVRGRVVDEEGSPLEGVRVRVTDQGEQPCVLGNFFDGAGREAITDRAGAYLLAGIAGGRTFAVGRLPGRADGHTAPFEVDADATAPDLVLRRGVAFVVRVEDPSGRLLPGAAVRVGPDPEYHRRWLGDNYEEPPTQTAADGRVALRDMPRTPVSVLATHSRYAPVYKVVDLRVELPASGIYTVRLAPPVTLRGRVIDDAGTPVAGAGISIGNGSPPGGYATTDAEGRFAIPRLRAGTAWATIDIRTYRHKIAELLVSDADVEIRITRLTEDQLARLKTLSAKEDELYEALDEHEWGSPEYKELLGEYFETQSKIERLRGVPQDP